MSRTQRNVTDIQIIIIVIIYYWKTFTNYGKWHAYEKKKTEKHKKLCSRKQAAQCFVSVGTDR